MAVWLVIALELLGWLEKIQGTLERVHLIPGRNMFTLWELVKGIVVVTVFVFVTTFVARTVERRVMRLIPSRCPPASASRSSPTSCCSASACCWGSMPPASM